MCLPTHISCGGLEPNIAIIVTYHLVSFVLSLAVVVWIYAGVLLIKKPNQQSKHDRLIRRRI